MGWRASLCGFCNFSKKICKVGSQSKSLTICLRAEALFTAFPKWERQPKLLTGPAHNLVHWTITLVISIIYSTCFVCLLVFLMQCLQLLDLSTSIMRKQAIKTTNSESRHSRENTQVPATTCELSTTAGGLVGMNPGPDAWAGSPSAIHCSGAKVSLRCVMFMYP